LSYTILRSKLKSAKVTEQEIAVIVKRVEIKGNQLRNKPQDNSGGKWMLGVLLIAGALFAGVYLPSYQEDTIKSNLIVTFGPTIIGWYLIHKEYNNRKRY
jgi:hypothetical protein